MSEQPSFDAKFEAMRALVHNLRSVLPPLTEGQSQLVGLYILNAVYVGEGEPHDLFPVLHEPERPRFSVIDGGAK